MPTRRVTPLAGWSVVAAFVLIGIALIATVWSTRASVIGATDAVRRGQAIAIEQAVRADLAELDVAPSTADLEAILALHVTEGLRYLAMVDGRRQIVAAAGTPVGQVDDERRLAPGQVEQLTGRVRMTIRAFRRRIGRARFIIELEPIQADALRATSTLTLGIGVVAALSLLGVAIVLVRREARRNADERAREAERRLAHVGEMSAVLAHEIRNPLASLKGNAQLLASMLPAGDKPRAKADRVVEEALRLEHLTNDLLHFVRTGAIQRTSADPASVVGDAATSVTAEVRIDASRAPATWSLDAGRIREVVINLVDNAEAAGPPVEVTVRTEARSLVIDVDDHGPGVPAAERDKIFEPFFTGKTQGTGLGLAVARRIVELHGGTLTALSSPHGGARFRAVIPEN